MSSRRLYKLFSDLNWCDKLRIASDENSFFYNCFVFIQSIIIAGYGTGADVDMIAISASPR